MPARIAALMAFHDEMRFLPGWVANVTPHVDQVVLLDDASTDEGGRYMADCPKLARSIRLDPATRTEWNEVRNRHELITAGQSTGCDWFLTIDADERLAANFWADLDRLLGWADENGVVVFQFVLRELWDSPRHYRNDGIWGRKKKAAFFRNLGAEHVFDEQRWHGEWVPMQALNDSAMRLIPYNLYHLKMIHAADRVARRDRYNALDPYREFQAIGYDYLTDETGLTREEIAPGQEYVG